jgi:outer membrane immunogenic protein
MNRFILTAGACVLTFATASPCFAADMPGRYGEPAYFAPAFGWGGFYVGINGGYGWGQSDWSGGGVTAGSTSPAGGLFGGTVGFTRNTVRSSLAWKATPPAAGSEAAPARGAAYAVRRAA